MSGSAGSSLESVPLVQSYYSGDLHQRLAGSRARHHFQPPDFGRPIHGRGQLRRKLDYASTTQFADFTIAQATPTVTVTDNGGTYDGETFPAANSIKGMTGSAGSTLENVVGVVAYYSGTYSTASSSRASRLSPRPRPGRGLHRRGRLRRQHRLREHGSTHQLLHRPGHADGNRRGHRWHLHPATHSPPPPPSRASAASASDISKTPLARSYYTGTYSSTSQLPASHPYPAAPIHAGSYTALASFPGSTDYTIAASLVDFTVAKAQPQITWTSPSVHRLRNPAGSHAARRLGQRDGNITYNPAPGTYVDAGTARLSRSHSHPRIPPITPPSPQTPRSTSTRPRPSSISAIPAALTTAVRSRPPSRSPARVTTIRPPRAWVESSPTLTYYPGSGTSGTRLGAAPPTIHRYLHRRGQLRRLRRLLRRPVHPVSFTIAIGEPKLGLICVDWRRPLWAADSRSPPR